MIVQYDQLELFGKLLFERATIKSPFTLPSRMPDSACFLYVLEGEFKTIGEVETKAIFKDEAVLLRCGNYVYKLMDKKSKKDHKSLVIHFHRGVLEKIYQREVPSFIKNKPETKKIPAIVRFKANKLIDKYVTDVSYYFDNPFLVNEDILILKLKEIILLLLQTEYAVRVREILSHLFAAPATVSFKEVIEANIFQDLNNSELATLTNNSLTSFKRKFKEIYSSSPKEYIMKRRIEAAAEQLKLSSKSITEVAFDCGFKDLSHFSKLFKAKMEVSPSSFRKKILGRAQPEEHSRKKL